MSGPVAGCPDNLLPCPRGWRGLAPLAPLSSSPPWPQLPPSHTDQRYSLDFDVLVSTASSISTSSVGLVAALCRTPVYPFVRFIRAPVFVWPMVSQPSDRFVRSRCSPSGQISVRPRQLGHARRANHRPRLQLQDQVSWTLMLLPEHTHWPFTKFTLGIIHSPVVLLAAVPIQKYRV